MPLTLSWNRLLWYCLVSSPGGFSTVSLAAAAAASASACASSRLRLRSRRKVR